MNPRTELVHLATATQVHTGSHLTRDPPNAGRHQLPQSLCEYTARPLGRTSSIRPRHDIPSPSPASSPPPPRRALLLDPGSEMAHQPGFEPQFDPYRSDGNRPFTPDQPIFNEPLLPPAAPHLAPSEGPSTPRDSYLTNTSPANSAPLLGTGEKGLADAGNFSASRSKPLHKKPLIWLLAIVGLALVAAAVVVPVYFTVIKPKNNSVSSNNGSNSDDPPVHQPPSSKISGGDGSTITAEDGTQFTYTNPFGGICEYSVNLLHHEVSKDNSRAL